MPVYRKQNNCRFPHLPATFIGASILLYKATGEKRYLDNAILAADYTVKDMSAEHKVLPFEGGIEQGIYTAIFAEYMAWLVYDCGQTQYLPFPVTASSVVVS